MISDGFKRVKKNLSGSERNIEMAQTTCALSVLFEDFILDRMARGCSASTIRNYRKFVRPFVHYVASRGEVLSKSHFVYWAARMRESKSLATASSYIRHVLVFGSYLRERGVVDEVKIRCPQVTGGIKSLRTENLVAAIDAMEDDIKEFVFVLLDTGLRLGEICSFRKRDVDLASHTVTVRGKGGGVRSVGFGDVVGSQLRRRCRRLEDGDRVFPLDPVSYASRLKRIGRKLGFPLGPHRLRHTFAREFLSKSGDLAALQRILGHSTSRMTMHYARIYSDVAVELQRKLSWVDRQKG